MQIRETGSPLPDLGPQGIGHEVRNGRAARLAQVNGVLKEHRLVQPFQYLGDVNKGENEILGAGGVRPLGNEGLHLVQLPAQFGPDTVDLATGKVKPGVRGQFWTVFHTQERDRNTQVFVPFVTGYEGPTDTPRSTPRTNGTVNEVNAELESLHLKPLPFPVGEQVGERIRGIEDVVRENERFFTVVVFDTVDSNGRSAQRPVVFNANSVKGSDGTVFAPTVRLPVYGMEPRLLMGDTYRPNIGEWLPEVPRGFYSPALGGQNLKIARLTDSDIPGFRRSVEELGAETGLIVPEHLKYRGKLRQDPDFEISEPDLYGLDVKAPQFGPRDLDASEKIRLKFPTYGEIFSQIHALSDAFTLTAITTELARRDMLRISDSGRAAQEDGERMVFVRPYRVQHGEYTTEAIRTNPENGLPIDHVAGQVAVNTGIARIMPDVHVGTTSWSDVQAIAGRAELPPLRLLQPYEVIEEIGKGEMDIVTAAAAVKALHGKGYLELNL
jgi:hypothetical protein